MNCNVIQDLMILYTDNCCSDESRAIVEEHIIGCTACKKVLEEMTAPMVTEKQTTESKPRFTKINSRKASVLQSVLLFVSFALIVFGVAREAASPSGDTNGLWAIAVIVPATGFMMSLANWYFIRVYRNRKTFSTCSLIASIFFILIGYIWAFIHYQGIISYLFNGSVLSAVLPVVGCVLSIIFCILAMLLSNVYAKMIGKE